MLAHGAQGLEQVSQTAVLNNNYLATKLARIPGVEIPYAGNGHRLQEVRYSWQPLLEETGVGTEDVRRRLVDFGLQGYFTSHHPILVPEPFTLEPSESWGKAALDEYVDALAQISREAHEQRELVQSAPHNAAVHRIDEEAIDTPERWAMTWRGFRRKYGRAAEAPEPVLTN